MTDRPLVSIIIPTYNRAHLIGETLDSVLSQAYTNWECIVVDDGSSDDTNEIMKIYCESDVRFQYHKRPEDRPKGANASRNYGFELSKGSYINWFDSDDIMHPDKIKLQVDALNTNVFDYCIDKYINFVDNSFSSSDDDDVFLRNENIEVNLNNYLFHKVYWGTINFMGKRKILLNTKYDESLVSGHEYNFFVSLVSPNQQLKASYINQVLAYRRVHEDSIQEIQIRNKKQRLENKFNVYWKTYRSYKNNLTESQCLFLLQKTTLFYQKLALNKNAIIPLHLMMSEIKRNIGFIGMMKIYIIIIFSSTFNRGDILGSKFIKQIFNSPI